MSFSFDLFGFTSKREYIKDGKYIFELWVIFKGIFLLFVFVGEGLAGRTLVMRSWQSGIRNSRT
jgi:hypothetical protein